MLGLWLLISACHALSTTNLDTHHHHQLSRQLSDGGLTSSNVVHRFFHGSFVLDGSLYIDGGEVSTTDWQRANLVFNYTTKVDLSRSFSTNPNFSSSTSSAPTSNELDKGSCPNFNVAAYWVDERNRTVFTYGGEWSYLNPWITSASVPPEELWALGSTNDQWGTIDEDYDKTFPSLIRPGFGGFTYGDIGGFYMGGMHGSRGSQKTNIGGRSAAPGIQFYNFTDQSWTNYSTSAFYDSTFVYGNIQYVPNYGEQGIVVVIGGQSVNSGNLYPWDNVTVFDVATQQWYHQITSGETPDSRAWACNIGTAETSSNGTYEIFLHGGQIHDSDNQTDSQSVYILSLPAFVWMKANTTVPTSNDARWAHSCNIAGGRHMLSVGGLNPELNSTLDEEGTSEQFNTTDPYRLGIKVLDLTSLVWTHEFDPTAAAYQAPEQIKQYYDGHLRYPDRWNQQGLQDIFITSASNTISSPSPSPTPTPEPRRGLSGGAIAGIVVAVVVGLGIIAAALWFFILRKKTGKKVEEDTSMEKRAGTIEVAPETDNSKENEKKADLYSQGELESPPAPQRHELGKGYFSEEGRRELAGEEIKKENIVHEAPA